MELLVLDTNLKAIAILDIFESLIWTDKYYEYGDFEIYTKASTDMLNILQTDYYILLKESEHVMIIEDCKIEDDVENGDKMIFTGRSAESLLDRRIIWNQTILTGNLQNGIELLLNENVISPTIPDRTIPNLIFEHSDDPNITALTVDAQFTRTNLYDTIKKLCTINSIGFKITLSDDNKFIFKLYSGCDRTYDQIENPYVIFSPKFGNIISSNYSNSKRALKTITVVAGEGEDDARKTAIVGGGAALDRREMYTDARDLSQTVDNVAMSDTDYNAQLNQRGTEDLSENNVTESFDGQVDTLSMFKYGEDFYIGDVVQFVSKYGIEGRARIEEVIHSQNTNGIDVYPKFAMIK